jgi:hypothetical protein
MFGEGVGCEGWVWGVRGGVGVGEGVGGKS